MSEVKLTYRRSVEVEVPRELLATLGGDKHLTLRNLRELVAQATAVGLSDDSLVCAAVWGEVWNTMPAVHLSVREG